MEFLTTNAWFWIFFPATGITCAIIGYITGLKSGRSQGQVALLEVRDHNTQLEIELAKCREDLTSAGASVSVAPTAFNPKAAKTAFGKSVQQDDLKLVEGIGPKIEGLFHNFDIKTWKALSETSVAKCQEVLDSGGDRYLVHDPASWPMQARMAYEGKWKALARWQDEHKRGKL
jgi:predicted flap endonuclease-1-like 5' DNA nuclease